MPKTLIKTEPFSIVYKENTYEVAEESFGPNNSVFLVKHRGGGLFIAITRAAGLNVQQFWATIPQNPQRHNEAQEIGDLIAKHFEKIPDILFANS